MKTAKLALLGFSILMFVVQPATFACGSSILVGCTTCEKFVQTPAGTAGEDYIAYYWQLGTPANNSGPQPTATGDCAGILWEPSCTPLASWVIQGDWGNPGSTGDCPPSSAHTALKIEQRESEGSLDHSASLMTLDIPYGSSSNYDTDAVMGAGTTDYVPLPTPEATWKTSDITGTVSTTSGSSTVTGSGTSFTTALGVGQYITIGGTRYTIASITDDTTLVLSANAPSTLADVSLTAEYISIAFTAPTMNTGALDPSGYNVYAQPEDTATTSNVSGWGTKLNSSAITSSPALLPYTTIASSQYYAMSMLFDGNAVETTFVGPHCELAVGPKPAGLFVQNSAGERQGQVTVNWRTNVESAVASYQVFYAGKKKGNFKPIEATVTAPTGNNSAYSVSFPRPTKAAKFFVKVKATMTGGADQWSDVMKVGRNARRAELDD